MPRTEYAFCERVTATPTSPVHIRRVGPEGVKLGGGAPDTTLCGASLNHGWDLPQHVTRELIQRTLGIEHGRTCDECARRWFA